MKVCGGVVSMAKVAVARPLLPARSAAKTSKMCEPSASRSGTSKGEAQGSGISPSIEQENATGSAAEKEKDGRGSVDSAGGLSVITGTGALVSTSNRTAFSLELFTWSVAVITSE